MSGALANDFRDYIVANIDEDTPRLAYADWLEENGQDARAEFIRVQVERATRSAWDVAQVGLRLREEELLRMYGEGWLAELPVIDGVRWEGFRRGIVAEVSFSSFESMRANAHACRAVAPVEAVTVHWPRRREERRAGPPIAELRELSLTGRPDGETEVARLADSPQLSTLRVLTARGLWAEGLERLVASPHLARLKSLRLPSNNLGNTGILVLIDTATLTALEALDLSGRGVSERYNDDPIVRSPGMEALAGWEGLATVRSLNLSGNEFGRVGLRTLLHSPHLGALRELNLRGGRLDGPAVAEFREAGPGLRLEVLDLGENVLGATGAEHLAFAPALGDLKNLRLDRCEIPLAGACLLAEEAPFIEGLRCLEVGYNHFGPAGLSALLLREPSALHTLGLRDNDLFDKGAAVLAGSAASNTLVEVDLSRNHLGTGSARALGGTEHLRSLRILRLADNSIDRSDAAALAASQLGQRLAVLELENSPRALAITGNAPDPGDPIPF